MELALELELERLYGARRTLAICVMQVDNCKNHEGCGNEDLPVGHAPAWVVPSGEATPVPGEQDWHQVEEDRVTLADGSTHGSTLQEGDGGESEPDLTGFEMLTLADAGYDDDDMPGPSTNNDESMAP